MKRIILIVLQVAFVFSAFAKENKLSQSQAIMVELRDATSELGEQFIRVKEVESGKVTQITLEKDPSTPQVWNGYFVIQFFKGDNSTKTLDFQTLSGTSFFANISQNKSVQKVILFKTPEELALFEASLAEAQQKIAEKQIAKQIQVVRPKGLDSTPINKEKVEQLVRQQGRIQETTQLALEEAQTKKRMALLEQQQKLSEAAKKKKKDDALARAKSADEAYAKKNYKEAEKLYSEAVDLDPENESYYYRYAVSLYKVGNYNKSLAILAVADVDSNQSVEKDYYIALNHLKLKDYDKALKEFVEIREENSAVLSPMSSFFAGNIELQQQKFSDARKSMEYVLDNSKDPQLDRSAEAMLEQIDRLENYYESKKEKYRFTVYGGLLYDSNILNTADNNISTDVKAWRLSYGASALANLYRTPTSDFGAQISFADYYSMNSSMQNEATVQAADAMDIGITLPYHQEVKLAKNQMQLEVTPGYRNTLMAPNGGARTTVLKSTELSASLAAPVRQDLFLSGRLDVGADQSSLETSTGDDDLSGSRYGITLIPTKMLDLKGDTSLSGEIGYLYNNAQGKNFRYQKMSVAATYGFPAFAKGTGGLRADYALQDYKDAATPRKDATLGVTASYNKDLTKKWNLLLSLQLTNANSEVESYKYNKYLITSLFTYTHSILQK